MKVSNNFKVGSFYTMELQAGVGSNEVYVCTKILVDSFGRGVGAVLFGVEFLHYLRRLHKSNKTPKNWGIKIEKGFDFVLADTHENTVLIDAMSKREVRTYKNILDCLDYYKEDGGQIWLRGVSPSSYLIVHTQHNGFLKIESPKKSNTSLEIDSTRVVLPSWWEYCNKEERIGALFQSNYDDYEWYLTKVFKDESGLKLYEFIRATSMKKALDSHFMHENFGKTGICIKKAMSDLYIDFPELYWGSTFTATNSQVKLETFSKIKEYLFTVNCGSGRLLSSTKDYMLATSSVFDELKYKNYSSKEFPFYMNTDFREGVVKFVDRP